MSDYIPPHDQREYQRPPQGPPPRPPRPTPSSRAPVLLAILLGLVIGWAIYRLVDDWQARQNAIPRIVTARGALADEERVNIEIFENVSPSVVFITSMQVRSRLFGLDVTRIPQGAGSGIVWDQEGHIVTNYHVVAGATNGNVTFDVTLANHSNYRGQVIGVAPENDLAVLKINAPAGDLRPIVVGSSHDLLVGQKAYAIGNPFGLDQTLTTGIVSALGRQIPTEAQRTIKDVIQTDAAINPGNSGGPLIDSAGRMIGVNTAIFSPSGASAGIGFAIPVDTVNRVVPDLIAHGRVVRPQLGITAAHGTLVRRMGLTGVLVVDIEPGSGADKAGLRGTRQTPRGRLILGDLIVGIDGRPVKTFDDLVTALETHEPGETVQVAFIRDEERMTADVVLQ